VKVYAELTRAPKIYPSRSDTFSLNVFVCTVDKIVPAELSAQLYRASEARKTIVFSPFGTSNNCDNSFEYSLTWVEYVTGTSVSDYNGRQD